MGMTKHSQSTQSHNFAISLQYLTNEVGNGVKTSTSWIIVF